jgi:DNA-binding NtrC family response regulator
MDKVLIVDDDDLVRRAFIENLKDGGFSPLEASSGAEAIEVFKENTPASVFLDLKMPGIGGMETLKELKKINSKVPVIIVTAHGDIPVAVEAIKSGAYDFIIKPPDFDKLLLTARRAIENFKLEEKLTRLNTSMDSSLEYMLGKSRAMKKVIHQINKIAWTDFSLVMQGETGSGKSYMARVIHNLSRRAAYPFVVVDIGAIPETLVESELFGHEKGAFTGAEKKKKGFFEIANTGTLLIDELQNMSSLVQSKLLSAVEEKQIIPVGSTTPLKTDLRIIGTTNTDIIKAVREKKTFREDLYYRLCEYVILIPPLRERSQDIEFLAEKFCNEASDELEKKPVGISGDAYKVLKKHHWPGNVRELKNVIKRAVLFSDGEIMPEHVEVALGATAGPGQEPPSMTHSEELAGLSMSEVEKIAIKRTLEMTGNNKKKAAAALKIDYKTLLRKINQYGI